MITDADIKKMKEVFATKDDLKPMQKSLKKIEKKLDTTVRFFDASVVNHEKRIKRLEKHLDLPLLTD